MNIAIIGAGISGISAAYLLDKKHSVTLYEAKSTLGGHTNTIPVKESEQTQHVDTGFIVFNDQNYPNFNKFLDKLGVEKQDSDMSFSFFNPSAPFYYASTGLKGLFAQKKQLLNPKFYGLLLDINRFNASAKTFLESNNNKEMTMEDFIINHQFSNYFINSYLLPMGAAIWSCSYQDILDFPAISFIQFWKNHTLLTTGKRPVWKTVTGGSFNYIKAFQKQFSGTILCNTPIHTISRSENGVSLRDTSGKQHNHDIVILATHADQSLRLLEKPSYEEVELLSQWQYSTNHAILHTDSSLMPPNKNAWASWNYLFNEKQNTHACVTYYMNRLQKLDSDIDYFVTLNPTQTIDPSKIIKEILYTHPIYTFQSLDTQEKIKAINGKNRTYYCGSYLGYGFHEDGIRSSVDIAHTFGITL